MVQRGGGSGQQYVKRPRKKERKKRGGWEIRKRVRERIVYPSRQKDDARINDRGVVLGIGTKAKDGEGGGGRIKERKVEAIEFEW